MAPAAAPTAIRFNILVPFPSPPAEVPGNGSASAVPYVTLCIYKVSGWAEIAGIGRTLDAPPKKWAKYVACPRGDINPARGSGERREGKARVRTCGYGRVPGQ